MGEFGWPPGAGANVIAYAVEKGIKTIDSDCVKGATEAVTTIPTGDFSEGVDEAL